MQVVVLAEGVVVPSYLERPLETAGHQVLVVRDVEAFERSLRDRPGAIFLPRRIGAEDGIALVDRIKSDPATAKTPTIVYGMREDDARAARTARADGFLRVPFTAAEVLDVLGVTTRDKRMILLADDSDFIHKHTVPILEDAGYEVVSAMDGAEAIVIARARKPDLIITDIEMPKMDGYEVCKTIKEDPLFGGVPVVICSSRGEAADMERGFDVGADDYLTKPVVPEELVSRLRNLFAGIELSGREKIVVVDDSPAVRHLVADSLARQGFDVTTAEDGADGLDRAREVRPDMVITDYDMPRMNGFELVHAIKRDPELRDTPVLMLTARDTRRDQAQMRAAGLTSYLVKPFSVDKCIAMVERILAEKRLTAYKEISKRYVSEGTMRAAERAAASGSEEIVRSEERFMSVFFSDISGFTMMSGKMQPSAVVEVLNRFFDLACPIIASHGGDIDKFIGDAIMALFEDSREFDEPGALRAVRSAFEVQEKMKTFDTGTGDELTIRVGINTGWLVRGDIGARDYRRDYTVIGDTVNRANRYEANAPKGGVLIAQSTYDLIADFVDVEPHAGIKLKGVVEPVTGFVVTSIRPEKKQ